MRRAWEDCHPSIDVVEVELPRGEMGIKDSTSRDNVYVLHGYWDTLEEKDAMVVRISLEPEPVMEELDRIADGRAGAYIELCGDLQEERGEGYYEVMDARCRYARFYIKEMPVDRGDDPGRTGADIDPS